MSNVELQGQVQNQATVTEHDGKVGAKKVVQWGYDAATDTSYRIDSNKYGLSRLDDTGDPGYFGFEDQSGNWYILQLGDSSGTALYVRGTGGVSTVWSARAAQSYVEYNVAF